MKCLIDELFRRNWTEELSEEQEDAIDEKAEALVDEYGWGSVLSEVKLFVEKECSTPETAINAAHIWGQLGWYTNPIPDAYDFLGLFYCLIGFDTEKQDSGDILDSLTSTFLPAQGYGAADLMKHPYYMPEIDPEMIAAVDCINLANSGNCAITSFATSGLNSLSFDA